VLFTRSQPAAYTRLSCSCYSFLVAYTPLTCFTIADRDVYRQPN
jgi:hypothetical protein